MVIVVPEVYNIFFYFKADSVPIISIADIAAHAKIIDAVAHPAVNSLVTVVATILVISAMVEGVLYSPVKIVEVDVHAAVDLLVYLTNANAHQVVLFKIQTASATTIK